MGKNENWIVYLLLPFIVLAILIHGCVSGGGGDSPGTGPIFPPIDNSHLLSWTQEPYYEDNTAMDLFKDVKCYEIYVSKSALLDGSAEPCAAVAGVVVDNTGTAKLSESFDLESLRPFGINADNGAVFVFMKTESVDNVTSEFSQPHQWGAVQLNMEVVPQ